MKTKRWLGGLVVLGLAGCSGMNNTEAGALGGGAIGAGTGALLGSLTGHAGAGAAIGAGVGAITGGLVGNSQDKAEARHKEAVAEWAAQHPALQLNDVVAMAQSHVSDDLIIHQMQVSRSYYNLRPEDITYLKSQGVSDRVVYEMQSRRGGGGATVVQLRQPVYVVEPAPPPVAVGVGFGWGRRW
jgi:uncharacterized protein YcfJ